MNNLNLLLQIILVIVTLTFAGDGMFHKLIVEVLVSLWYRAQYISPHSMNEKSYRFYGLNGQSTSNCTAQCGIQLWPTSGKKLFISQSVWNLLLHWQSVFNGRNEEKQ